MAYLTFNVSNGTVYLSEDRKIISYDSRVSSSLFRGTCNVSNGTIYLSEDRKIILYDAKVSSSSLLWHT
jgi:hypothetical protein